MKLKFISVFAILALVIPLSACSEESAKDLGSTVDIEKTGFPIVKEPLKFSMIAPGTGLADWKDMPTLKDYAEKTNINFDYTTPPLTDFSTKINLAFASHDLPNVIYGAGNYLTPLQQWEYAQQGFFLPLEDYIADYAPNLDKLLKEDDNLRKSITAPDGHIYSFPSVSKAIPWPRAPLWFNGSWLAKLGITKLPDTLDEFHNLLVRFRDEDPNGNGKKDDIPLTGSTLDNPLNGLRPWLITAFGLLGNDIEVHDGKVSFAPIENSFKEWVTYMHQLYSEGLIDKEMFTQSESNLKAKGAANQVGLFPAWYSFQVTGQTEDQALQNPMISPLVKSADQKKMTVGTTGMAPGAFMVTKGTQNAAALVRWVDYFYSSEGFLYINQGPAGSLWEYKTDSKGEKVRVYKSDLSEDQAEEKRGHITPDYGVVVPGCEIYLPQIRNSADDSKADDFQSFIKNEAKVKDSDYAALPYPSLFLSEEQSDIVNQIKVDLQTYVENMEAKFVTGAADINSQWDTYIATIQKMNIDAYIKAYQDAYDVWAKK